MIQHFGNASDSEECQTFISNNVKYVPYNNVGNNFDLFVLIDEIASNHILYNRINHDFITNSLTTIRNKNQTLRNTSCKIINITISYKCVVAFSVQFEYSDDIK
jgi:hypothetical protein